MLDSGPLEHSVPGRAPVGGAVLYERLTVSDPLEHSGLRTSGDSVPAGAVGAVRAFGSYRTPVMGRRSNAEGGYDGPSAIRMYSESRLGGTANG